MKEDKRGEAELASQGKKLLLATWRLEKMMDLEYDGELRIVEVRVRAPREEGEDFLVTVKAVTLDNQRFVGFHGAQSFSEALRGAVERVNNSQIKWKADQAYGAGAPGK